MNQTKQLEVVLRRLTPLQQKVAALLLQGSTVKGAAEANGLHRTTVHTWCRTNPTFRLALQEARNMQAEWLADETQIIAAQAIGRLTDILHDDRVNPNVRLRAALAIIDRAARRLQEPDGQAEATEAKVGALRKMLQESAAQQKENELDTETLRQVAR